MLCMHILVVLLSFAGLWMVFVHRRGFVFLLCCRDSFGSFGRYFHWKACRGEREREIDMDVN